MGNLAGLTTDLNILWLYKLPQFWDLNNQVQQACPLFIFSLLQMLFHLFCNNLSSIFKSAKLRHSCIGWGGGMYIDLLWKEHVAFTSAASVHWRGQINKTFTQIFFNHFQRNFHFHSRTICLQVIN